jgi:hypothetical protein
VIFDFVSVSVFDFIRTFMLANLELIMPFYMKLIYAASNLKLKQTPPI